MLRWALIASLALVVGMGCASKRTTDADAMADAAIDESAVMSFDPMGSDSGNIPGLQTVNFEFDRATLTSAARAAMAGNAEWLRANPNVNVQIEGHCDERGSIEYNLALGERRARAARDYLVNLGIDADRLSIISFGEERPLDPASNEAAWARNRRANFVPLAR